VKTLVTGGTGFIGRHLVSALRERGEDLRCLVRQPDRELEECGVEQIVGDITDVPSLRSVAEDVSTVYHLAAAGHVGATSQAAYEQFHALNVVGLQNLLDEVVRANCIRKFVHFSSTAAMGLIVGTASEQSDCCPQTPYQKSKHESEELALSYHRDHGVPVLVVRPSMIYGPGDRNRDFLSMCRLVRVGLFPVPCRVEALTPLVYVTDVIRGAILAADRGAAGEIYILTSDAAYPVVDLVRHIGRELGVPRAGIFVSRGTMSLVAALTEKAAKLLGKPPIISRQRVISVFADRTFDITKARTELGYEPQVSLEEGVAKTVEWFRKQDLV
jgi:farnesol dehydrogenase